MRLVSFLTVTGCLCAQPKNGILRRQSSYEVSRAGSDVATKELLISRIRDISDSQPVDILIGSLIGEPIDATPAYNRQGLSGERIEKLYSVSAQLLESIAAMRISDLDLHEEGSHKLEKVFGPELTQTLLELTGLQALDIISRLDSGFGKSRVPSLRDLCYRILRSSVRPAADGCSATVLREATAKKVKEMVNGAEDRRRRIVRMENEVWLRFALGPVAASRLLLEAGIGILIMNMAPSTRLVTSFHEYLSNPLEKLRGLSAVISRTDSLIHLAVYRPQNTEAIKFLVSESRAKELDDRFPVEFVRSLLEKGILDGLVTKPEWNEQVKQKLWSHLLRNRFSTDNKFMFISMHNWDWFQRLFGSSNMQQILSDRGYWALGRLGAIKNYSPNKPKDPSLDVLKLAHSIASTADKNEKMFGPHRALELAFLFGPKAGEILARYGINKPHFIQSAADAITKQDTTLIELLFPDRALLKPYIDAVISQEVSNIESELAIV